MRVCSIHLKEHKTMTTIRLTLAILILAGIAHANAAYGPIDTTNFANRAADYEGRLVAVSGKVCAVSADGKSVRLFDAKSKALIDVYIGHLQRDQRRLVLENPVLQLSVYGKAEVMNGKLVVDAHKVVDSTDVAHVNIVVE
jgi:hypothetical protein